MNVAVMKKQQEVNTVAHAAGEYLSFRLDTEEYGINLHGLPEKITIDKSGANTAAIHSVNDYACVDVELIQSKHLNNVVQPDHRAVNRITDPMPRFKSFWCAQKLIAGIGTIHMVKKGQFHHPKGRLKSAADQFYSQAL